MPKSQRRPMPVALAMLGSQMVGFTLAGIAIDYFAGTMPWLTVALTIVGFVAVFVQLVKLSKPAVPGDE